MANEEATGVVRDGLRVLRDPYGQLVQVDPQGANALLREGINGERFTDVTEAEVQQRDFEIANSGIQGQARTYARSAYNALGDFATLPARLVAPAVVPAVNALARGLGGPEAGQLDPNQVNRALALGAPALIQGALTSGDTTAKLQAAQSYADETRQLKGINPKAAFAGELGANIATGIVTGGASTAAAKAASSALARVGMGRVAAGALGAATALGAEGAVYGALGAEGAARDAGQLDGATAEQLIHGMGLGFLIGSATGGGLHLAGEGFRAGMAGVRKKVAGVQEKVTALLEKKSPASDLLRPEVDQRMADLWAKKTGASRELLEEIGPQNQTPQAQSKRARIANFDENLDKNTVEFTKAVNQMEEGLSQARTYVDEFTPRVKDVSKMMRESGITPQLAKKAKAEGMEMLAKTLRQIDVIVSNVDNLEMVEPVRKTLSNHFHNFRNQAANLIETIPPRASAAEVNGVMNSLKKDAQKFEREIGNLRDNKNYQGTGLSIPLKEAWNQFETRVQEPLRQHLERMDIWGIAGEAQAAINLRYKRAIDTADRYGRELLMVDPVKEWRPQPGTKYYADTGKSKTWLSSIGTAEGTTRQEMTRQHLEYMDDLLGAIHQFHPPSEKAAQAISRARDAYERITQILEDQGESVRLVQGMKAIRQAEQRSANVPWRDLAGRATGTALGGLGGGIPGAVAGAAGLFDRIPDIVQGAVAAGPMGARFGAQGMLYRPATAIDAATALQGIAGGVASKIRSETLKLVGSRLQAAATKAAAKIAPVGRALAEVPRRAVPIIAYREAQDDRRELHEARIRRLQEIQQNPDQLVTAVNERIPGLAHMAPGVVAPMVDQINKAVSFLLAKAPVGFATANPLSPAGKTVVPDAELQRYERLWRAVEDPLSVMHDLSLGRATPDQIEALKLSPGTFELIRQSVIEAIVEATRKGNSIPLERRMQLDQLLELEGAGVPAFGKKMAQRINSIRVAKISKQSRPPSSSPRVQSKIASSFALPQHSWGR